MRFRILGPIEVRRGETPVPVGGPQQRALLAVLLVHANHVVSVDRLIGHLWGDAPPVRARPLLQGCVADLRKALRRSGPERLLTRAPGYLLQVVPGELDADRFDALTAAARAAPSAEASAAMLHEALDLWRGPALDGVTLDGLHPAVARLEERRLEAVEDRIEADLALGREAGLVAELQARVREHPLRERLWALLMRALNRAGRQADALAAYQDLRTALVEQLGVDPGPEVREAHLAVLAGESGVPEPAGPAPDVAGPAPDVAGPAPERPHRPAVPAQLPAAVSGFTGRAEHLTRLDELAADRRSMVIAVITGTAGVGKTALAVHWGHRIAERFPDGQLYANLRGFDSTAAPARPVEILTAFLLAVGVPSEQVPVDLDAASALYRTLLAGRRMLVVLDNAAGADQVRPLLPGAVGCLVAITSRDRLGGLVAREGARRVALDVLPADEATTLLARLLGADAVAAETSAARALCQLCACLPLAMRIAAADLDGRIADQVARLRDGDRLGALQVDGDPDGAVRAAFDASYARLDDGPRRLFRLLGPAPALDLVPPSAAALAGVDEGTARVWLTRLATAHLLDQPAPGRYTCHDLLRTYATERAHAEEAGPARHAAVTRWLRWYRDRAVAAARVLNPDMLRLPGARPPAVPARPEPFLDDVAALEWLDEERGNLIAAVRHAAAHGPPEPAWVISDALRGYFWLRMFTLDWLDVAAAGLAAATTGDSRTGQAAAHLSLGAAYGRQGRHREAVEHYAQAVRLNRESGWLDGEAAALGDLGNVHWWAGRPLDAADHYAQALALAERTGRLAGQAVNLGNLGAVHWDLGDLTRSASFHRRALELDRHLGSRYGEAVDLGNLGRVHLEQGHLEAAVGHVEKALALHRELGDRSGEAEALRVLAEARCRSGHLDQAHRLAEQAVELARRTGSARHESDALNAAGCCAHARGRDGEAAARHQDALNLARESGNRYPEIIALAGLSRAARDPARAVPLATQALVLARQAGFRLLEGHALAALAVAHGRCKGSPEAGEAGAAARSEARALLAAIGSAAATDPELR